MQTNQETTVKTFRKEYGNAERPQTWFIINATMDTYEQITGNYTCVSVEDLSRFSSCYIFVSRKSLTSALYLLISAQLIETTNNALFSNTSWSFTDQRSKYCAPAATRRQYCEISLCSLTSQRSCTTVQSTKFMLT